MANYTDETKAHAVDLYREVGTSEASRQTGIPGRTIARWAQLAGAVSQASRQKTTEARAKAAEEVSKAWGSYRSQEAYGSGGTAAAIRRQIADLSTGTPIRSPKGEVLIRRTTDAGVEIPYLDIDAKTIRDLAVAYGILIDKAELLSGNATERVESWAMDEMDVGLRDLIDRYEEVIDNG